jgi:hypothetical protein
MISPYSNPEFSAPQIAPPLPFPGPVSKEEVEAINRSQNVTGSQRHRDLRYPLLAFIQEGVGILRDLALEPV